MSRETPPNRARCSKSSLHQARRTRPDWRCLVPSPTLLPASPCQPRSPGDCEYEAASQGARRNEGSSRQHANAGVRGNRGAPPAALPACLVAAAPAAALPHNLPKPHRRIRSLRREGHLGSSEPNPLSRERESDGARRPLRCGVGSAGGQVCKPHARHSCRSESGTQGSSHRWELRQGRRKRRCMPGRAALELRHAPAPRQRQHACTPIR